MRKYLPPIVLLSVALLVPALGFCQTGVAGELRGLHKVLADLKDEMMPLCGQLTGIGQAIAGFAATFYIGSRIWKSIASAEPIDFYPLFRPFVLTFCIINFPLVIALMEGILSPTVTGTETLVDNTNASIQKLMEKRRQQLDTSRAYQMYESNNGEGNKDLWMLYTQGGQDNDDFLGIGSDIKFAMAKAYYNLKNWFKNLLSMLLEILYEAAALCINTIRTFNLIIMALIGPIVFGLAVFDGFQHTLPVYLARYVNFYMWLPIANILGALLGKIQEGMIKLDMAQIAQYGDSFFTTADVGYIVFMIIGIVSYFTIPNISSMIINAGGGSTLTSKIGGMSRGAVGMGVGMATGVAGGAAGMAADMFGDMNTRMTTGAAGSGTASDYFKDKLSG